MATSSSTNIHIGTSGWHYEHWMGTFYPQDVPKKDFLAYYKKHFQAVEINNSFYQLPRKETLVQWRDTVPDNFVFAVKASRYITHMKKLKDPAVTLSQFLDAVKPLDGKLGPILFQLPPKWRFDRERFYDFLEALPDEHRYAFEFRDPSWEDTAVYEGLTEVGAAFCMYDLDGRMSPKAVTADFIYIRLHGPDGAYKGQYATSTLSGWAGAISTWFNEGREIFCFFDNDEAGYAAQDALRLQKMLQSG
jgi:uncharacterized protein YecE (DUF72 family)